jgi:hypothetical protein
MKRNLIYALTLCVLAFAIVSCSKTYTTPQASSSLTITDAIPGSTVMVPNFNSTQKLQYYKSAQQIPAGGSFEFGGYLGDIPLSVSQLADTTHTVFNSTIHIAPNSVHNLFLTGTLTAPDYLFTTDTLAFPTDSAVNVRFVNISTNSNPISIDISTNAGTPIVASLPYKGVGEFLHFTFKTTVPATSYNIEFRDVATNKVLYTYALTAATVIPAKLFKDITLVFKGLPGGTGVNAQGVILVNDF